MPGGLRPQDYIIMREGCMMTFYYKSFQRREIKIIFWDSVEVWRGFGGQSKRVRCECESLLSILPPLLVKTLEKS